MAGKTKDTNREVEFCLGSGTSGSSPPLKEAGALSCHHHCQNQKRKKPFFYFLISDKKTKLRCSKLKKKKLLENGRKTETLGC